MATADSNKKKQRSYVYKSLSEATANTIVDVYGIVKFLKPPRQTRGTDLILIVSLIDQTLFQNDQKLVCVLFFKPDKVPKLEIGNVVRFHRLKIGTHNGNLQGGSSPGFSWLVFDGPDTEPSSSAVSYTYTDEDKKKDRAKDTLITAGDEEDTRVMPTKYRLKKKKERERKSKSSKQLAPSKSSSESQSSSCTADQPSSQLSTQIATQFSSAAAVSRPDCCPHSQVSQIWEQKSPKKPKIHVKELFDWAGTQETTVSDSDCHLTDIAVNAYFNLTCQVVSTCVLEDGVCFLLRVWDGTRPIYRVHEAATEDENVEVHSDPDLLQRASEYLCDVSIFDDHFSAASRIKPGMYVKLYNLHAALHVNLETREDLTTLPTIELVMHHGTHYGRGLLILDDTSEDVRKLKSKLDSIRPCGTNILLTDNQHGSRSSCSDLGSRSGKAQPSTFGVHRSDCDKSASVNKPDSSESDEGIDVRLTTKRSTDRSDLCEDRLRKACRQGLVSGEAGPRSTVSESQTSDEPRCMQETATVALHHPHITRTHIEDVWKHSVPYKFRIKARVLDYHPLPQTEVDFIHVYCAKCNYLCKFSEYEQQKTDVMQGNERGEGSSTAEPDDRHMSSLLRSLDSEDGDELSLPCLRCCNSSDAADTSVELTYMLRLLLQDNTGWLVANLWRTDATKFFKDLKPAEVLSDPSLLTDIQQSLESICPAGEKTRPWMECCVASYSTDATGVTYKIFDTVVV